MKRAALLAGLAVVALAAIVLLRTARLQSRQVTPPPPRPIVFDTAAAASRLAEAIRVRTISREDGPAADSVFARLHATLAAAFPRTHVALSRERMGGSLLFTWPGTDPSRPPIILTGHLDVVPIDPASESRWTHPAFAGVVADGFIWGRGAIDDKGSVLAILEAIEALLVEGFAPARSVYLAFGHDEEISGLAGAKRLAAALAARGVRADWVLDEGGAITQGLVPGVSAPVAVVGIAEKGYVDVELVATDVGGHSSTPPAHTAIGRLARAINRIEERPFPARAAGATRALLEHAAPEMSLPYRIAFANLWLFQRPVLARFAEDQRSAAAVRTTTAVTVVSGGTKANVLPTEARAVVNFRTLPGDSAVAVIEAVRRAVDDSAVAVRALHEPSEASAVSSPDSEGYRAVAAAIRQTFPGTVVAPYLVIGATDARHYAGLTSTMLRFAPGFETDTTPPRAHGTDERVGVGEHAQAIRFYAQLIRDAAR
ncbi:MAG TPA: M20/M25/M40 family metallo-hydrolase [Gemmatimonadales bacterium]|nr:M20/M25/M40 family metallo-hydrolase [Gemmatimonadales bacterium]